MILNRKIRIPENIEHNIKIVGDVGQVKMKEESLKGKVMAKTQPGVSLRAIMAKTQPGVSLREIPQTKPDTQQVMRPRPRQTDKNNELNNLELLSEITTGRTVNLRNPLEALSVGDGTVILVDKKLNCLQRINTGGNIVRRYKVRLSQQAHYKSACVYGNYLFVLTSNNVIKMMFLDGFSCNIEYKPEGVRRIDNISASGDNVILITESGYQGRILEYNTWTNKVIHKVTDINLPGKVSVLQDGHHTKYIVRGVQGRKWLVNIYNKDWNLISTIDNNPDVLTVTPGGKLLLVHDNRIHEYSHDGRLTRELLDKYKFYNIRDITYSGGCLWVLEKNPDVTSGIIKIFH